MLMDFGAGITRQDASGGRMRIRNFAGLVFLILLTLASVSLGPAGRQQEAAKGGAMPSAAQDYLVYVVCEAADKDVLVRFGPKGARIERETHIGLMPTDINGPHGIAVSPDKKFIYVTVGHGRPDGSVWKLK